MNIHLRNLGHGFTIICKSSPSLGMTFKDRRQNKWKLLCSKRYNVVYRAIYIAIVARYTLEER